MGNLEKLFDNSKNLDEKCLLLSVLFVGYLNTDSSNKYKLITHNKKNEKYFRNYSSSREYIYLLRNISYYIDDFHLGNKYYIQCLSTFKYKDPVNI